MQTPVKKPKTDDRLLILPEAEASRESRDWTGALIVLALVAVLLVGALGGYVFAQGDVDASDAAAVTAERARAAAEQDSIAATADADRLAASNAELTDQLGRAKDEIAVLRRSRGETRSRLERSQATAKATRDQMRSIQGPPVSEGRHMAWIRAVGTGQSPARIVLDPGRWLKGKAARQAAIADGAILPGEPLPTPHRYLRDTDTRWRILELSTFPTISVRGYNGIDGRSTIAASTLATIWDAPGRLNRHIRQDPFWVVVDANGIVTSLREQRYTRP